MVGWAEFAWEAGAGLVGVFAGVILALWTDRARQRRQDEQAQARERELLAGLRKLVLSSVVRNVSEARRIQIQHDEDPYLIRPTFDLAAWEATKTRFSDLASADESVLFARFFDQVNRLANMVEANRRLRADIEVRGSPDQGDQALLAGATTRLHEVAEDVRLEGLLLVTDHGEPIQKRLLGIPVGTPE